MHRVWGYYFGPDSDNLAKLTAAGAPKLIHTVRGVGDGLRTP